LAAEPGQASRRHRHAAADRALRPRGDGTHPRGRGRADAGAAVRRRCRPSSSTSGLDVYAGAFFDRNDAGVRSLVAERLTVQDDPSRAFASSWFRAPGAATAIDRGLRLDAEVMLVDDPVKRVDNMTMAHGLEARTPFLDHELVELAARAQARRGRERALFRPEAVDAMLAAPNEHRTNLDGSAR
jgi:Asparagine synthase